MDRDKIAGDSTCVHNWPFILGILFSGRTTSERIRQVPVVDIRDKRLIAVGHQQSVAKALMTVADVP